jgi:hypothetical protein
MKTKLVLLTALLLTFYQFGLGADRPTPPKDPIAGEWIFHGAKRVLIRDDGNAKYEKSGMSGVWRYLKNPETERKYEIIWDKGIYIDHFRLSADSKILEGKDKTGKPIHAERAIEAQK